MPSQILISASIVEPLAAFMAAAGVNEPQLVAPLQLGTPTEPYGEPQVVAAKVVQLFEHLSGKLGQPAFGVEYARAFPVGGTGAFGFILTQSKDMRTAVKAIARYTQIVMSGINVQYQAIDGGGQLTWQYPLLIPSPNIQFNSFVAALVILRLRAGLSADWHPLRVQLAHREPGAVDVYKQVFGPNVIFEQPVNRFTFRDSNLDRPNLSANPRLFEVVKQLGDILLAARKTVADFRTAVANQIVDHLGVSSPTLESVAEALGVTGRTVQRRLAKEGTSFEDVLDKTRRVVAERLLCDTDLSLTDVAFMLGFSELSAFTRAAKRWHGVPPRQFRADSRSRATG